MTGAEVEPVAGPRRYHLLELVGRGAFGDVYLAELDSGGFRRKVALKVLNDEASRRSSARRRIQEEARILGRLAHRHIVTALDFVRVGQRWAIVMDYVHGSDLDHVLSALDVAQQRMPPRAAFEIAAAVADALHAAYQAPADDGRPLGIIHRDIKSSNIRLSPEGDVRVLDFGIALAGDRPEVGSAIVGTETYMAPERFMGAAEHPSVDVYSLGITLVEMLTGRTLGDTARDPAEHEERVARALEEVRRAVEEVAPGLVLEVLELVGASVAFDPRQRPPAPILSARLDAIAVRIEGEPLRAFCRRFVPSVDALMGTRPIAVTGMWTEELSSAFSETTEVRGRNAAGNETFRVVGPSRLRRRTAWLVVLTLLFAAAVAGGAGAWWVLKPTVPEPAELDALTAAPATSAVTVQPPAPAQPPAVAPAPAPAPKPVRARSVPPRSAPVRSPAPDMPDVLRSRRTLGEAGGRVANARFTVREASRIEVVCGDRSAAGTSVVSVTDFPMGRCQVSAEFQGVKVGGDFPVEKAGDVQCDVVDGRLSCSTP